MMDVETAARINAFHHHNVDVDPPAADACEPLADEGEVGCGMWSLWRSFLVAFPIVIGLLWAVLAVLPK